MSEAVFVFGSNLAGRHGAGAARWAKAHRGAVYGQGVGRQGNSYAIPTKGFDLRRRLPLIQIQDYVRDFLVYAAQHPNERFQLTPIGCGLAGYHPSQIAPMFRNAPPNVILPDEFRAVLEPPQ